MMIDSLEMTGYRLFQHFRVEGLRRVNLLVGENNCGKTTVLEALRLLATGGHPLTFADIAALRGEIVLAPQRDDAWRLEKQYSVEHFFSGHGLSPGTSFTVQSRNKGVLEGKVTALVEHGAGDIGSTSGTRKTLWEGEGLEQPRFVRVEGAEWESPYGRGVFPIDDTGCLAEVRGYPRSALYRARNGADSGLPMAYLQVGTIDSHALRRMWDQVLQSGDEQIIEKMVQIVIPMIDRLAFLSEAPYWEPSPSLGGILVQLSGQSRRYPLGSFGDGARNLLGLALCMYQARGGWLLVDEIDTGLHYSVLGQLWRLVVEGARQLEMQVFATTHSLDCIRGLAALCEGHPELAEEVSLQKLHVDLERSVALVGPEIVTAAEHGVEVR